MRARVSPPRVRKSWLSIDELVAKLCVDQANRVVATQPHEFDAPLGAGSWNFYRRSTTAYVPIFGSENSIAPSATIWSSRAALAVPGMYASPLE